MSLITQVEPVTNLQRSYQALFSKVDKGPVVLTNRGTAAAILLSVPEYDQMRSRLAFLERQALADQAMAEMDTGHYVTGEAFEAELKRLGIE